MANKRTARHRTDVLDLRSKVNMRERRKVLDQMSVKELKKHLRAQSIPIPKTKGQMIERLAWSSDLYIGRIYDVASLA